MCYYKVTEDLHVGVLIRGHLGGVRQVDVLSGHEGTVHLLLIDVLDHRLKPDTVTTRARSSVTLQKYGCTVK